MNEEQLAEAYMSAYIIDATGRCCPDCQSTSIRYLVGSEHWDERNYDCTNCGAEWDMQGGRGEPK